MLPIYYITTTLNYITTANYYTTTNTIINFHDKSINKKNLLIIKNNKLFNIKIITYKNETKIIKRLQEFEIFIHTYNIDNMTISKTHFKIKNYIKNYMKTPFYIKYDTKYP